MIEAAKEEVREEGDGDGGELEEGEEKMEVGSAAVTDEGKDELSIYRLDDYDNDESGLPGVGNIVYDADIVNDPNLVGGDEDSEEDEDFQIRRTDNLVLVGKTEEDMCSLEVQVYDDDNAALYVHHEILLSAFPLALAWSPAHPKEDKRGNFCAIGTFKPEIELWDLDVVGAMDPVLTLGGEVEAKKSGKKGKKGKKKQLFNWKEGSHKNAVLSLSWNPTSVHHLASGSADNTVKVWDVSREACVATLAHHSDKVQSVEWSTEEAYALLTGGFDQTLHVADARQGDESKTVQWSIHEPIECCHWDPCNPPAFAVSTEAGNVFYYDARKPGTEPFLRIQAHDKQCTSFSFQRQIPGMLITSSVDATVRVWDVNVGEGTANLVDGRPMDIGAIFNVSASPDLPFIIAAGGSEDIVGIWDMQEKDSIKKVFGGRVKEDE
uniref:Periodic tryptophan protein 1 n=1 Tax=Palpitomonas bilix TaxID=652834 RepID=A0A7S3GI35_9EUKA